MTRAEFLLIALIFSNAFWLGWVGFYRAVIRRVSTLLALARCQLRGHRWVRGSRHKNAAYHCCDVCTKLGYFGTGHWTDREINSGRPLPKNCPLCWEDLHAAFSKEEEQ